MKYLLSILFVLTIVVVNAQTSTTNKIKCTALTTKGVQCKNTAETGSNTCRIHSTTAPRCGVNTNKSQPCKMLVPKSGDVCWRHKQ